MATAVTISIVVDSTQAQAAIGALNTSLEQAGVNGDVAFKKASGGLQQMGGHAATSLDAVRLLSQEFGLRLPRALEAMISRNEALSSSIKGMVGLLGGVAGIEVFAHLIKGAYDLYHNYIDLNAAADEYYKTLQKTREADFGGARTIETQMQRFTQATQVASQLRQQADALSAKSKDELTNPNNMDPVAGLADALKARDLEKQAVKAGQLRDESYKNGLELTHQQYAAQIELNHAGDAALVGAAKINAELKKKLEMNKEDRRYTVEMEKAAGNVGAPDAGATEQQTKDAQARAEAKAQEVLLNRESSLAIMKANDEVVQAGLEGDALETRKKLDSIREITAQIKGQKDDKLQIAAEVAAIEAKYDNEHAERLEKQWHDAQQAQRAASQSGLTGASRVTADFGNRLDQINSDRSLDPAVAAQLRIAAKTEEDQKLKELSDNFTSNALAAAQTRTEGELGGLQKIEAEAQRAKAELQKAYDAAYKDDQGNDLGSSSQRSALATAKSGIDADEKRQKQQYAEQVNAEDLQYAQEAAAAEQRVKEQGVFGWVAAYKNGIAEINAEDERRTARMEEQAAKQGATQEQIAARKVDIDRAANAQIEAQNLQMQHQIAGDLQSAFTNPVEFIKSAMEKMFFEIVASWVMKMHSFQAIFGSTMGAMQPGGGGQGQGGIAAGGGLLSKLMGGSHGTASGGGYSAGGGTSNGGGAGGGGTIASGGTAYAGPSGGASGGGGGSIGSTINGVGSLAKTVGNLFGFNLGGGAGGGTSSPQLPAAMTTDESPMTDMIPNVADPAVPDALSGVPGFGGDSGSGSGLTYNDATGQFDQVADPAVPSALSNVPGFGGGGSSAGGLASAAGAYAGAGMGAYQGYQSTVSAFESGNPLSGALGDAAAGAAIGSVIPGVGTIVGAAVGAGIGLASGLAGLFMDMGPKNKARNYYKQSIRPQLDAAAQNTNYGDFQSAVANVNRVSGDGLLYMKTHFGNEAGNWVNDNYMKKYVETIDTMITSSAAGGRQFTQMSAMQFHTGGTISGFGSFATSDNEGFIHAKMGETVMTPGATATHGAMFGAMNAGASTADIASAYLASAGGASAMPSGGGGDTHFHVHTLDTKTMTSWLRGGGAKMITSAQNNYNSKYAGDGIG